MRKGGSSFGYRFMLQAIKSTLLWLVLACFMSGASTAQAATFVVDRLDDAVVSTCSAAANDCTLRGAITQANSTAGTDNINFDATLFNSGAKTITVDVNLPTINDDVIVTGPGAKLLTLRSSDQDTLNLLDLYGFNVNGSKSATIEDLMIENFGSGVNNAGTATIRRCILADNIANVDNSGTTNARDCNFITSAYGVLNRNTATCTLSNCTITQNFQGIANLNTPDCTVTNCTISGNNAFGIISDGGTTTLRNSLVVYNALNSTGASDTQGTITDGGNNIVGGTASEAGLDPNGLQDNGGPVTTIALIDGSPAINAANNANAPSADARGIARPQYGVSDIGAYEFNSAVESLVVTTTADENNGTSDPNFGSGTSLREAIIAANTDGVDSSISFNATAFAAPRKTITLNGTQLPNLLGDGTLEILAPTAGLEISGNNQSRIFNVSSSADVFLFGLTLRDGLPSGATTFGGALFNSGKVTLASCTLNNNSATNGGAIFSVSDLSGKTLTLRQCSLSGNSATLRGGAISNGAGLTALESCTIANNTAPSGSGSGIVTVGDANTRTELHNSIVAGNTTTDLDLNGGINAYQSNGYNLVGDGNATGEFVETGDHVINNAAPGLAALADNGGPSKTLALITGSPAVDAGNTSFATDQRSVSRPQNGADDVGAFEADKFLNVTIAPSFSATFSESAGAGATKVRITRTGSLTGALAIELRSSDTSEATIVDNATIPSGQSFVDISVDAVDDRSVDGPQTVFIKATASNYISSKVTLSVTDNEVPPSNLSLRLLPAAFSESKTGTSATLVIQHDRTSTATAVTVNLSSSDARLNLPTTVQIPIGKRSVEVAVTVTADSILTGTKTATITADATNFTAANTTATIYDAQARISLSLAPGQSNTISEGTTNNQTVLRVTRNTPTTGALVVNLSLNKGAGQVSYPSSVTIADGAAYVEFTVSSVDDSAIDGTQSVVVQGSATGYGSSTAQLYVKDNDGPAAMSVFKADESSK